MPVLAAIVVALGLLLPAVAGAQQQSAAVGGTVVDAVSNRVAGAAVLLLDSLGFEIPRMHRRAIAARLRSSPHDTPLSATSYRRQERAGLLASVTRQVRCHTMKVGMEADHQSGIRVQLREPIQRHPLRRASYAARGTADGRPLAPRRT